MEKWYALQFIPSFEKKVIEAMNDAAIETPAEVNIFNPYYMTKPEPTGLPMKTKKKVKLTRTAVYEGYLFFFIEDSDFKDYSVFVSERLRNIVNILKDSIPDEQIDEAYSVALGLKRGSFVSETQKKVNDLTAFIVGKTCLVKSGALVGMKGIVESVNKSRSTIMLSMTVFDRSVSIEVPNEALKVE